MGREADETQNDDSAEPDTRSYIHVRPTETVLDPSTVTTQLRRLHGLAEVTNSGASGIRDALFETDTLRGALALDERTPVRLEVLLVAPGGPEPSLEYYLGCEPASQLETLERLCAQLFPTGYELTRTDLSLAEALTDTPTGRGAGDNEPTPAEAVQWYGRGERRRDWQTRLTPYEAFEGRPEDGQTTPPLADVATVLADSPHPAVYQALVEPFRDYRVGVEGRRRDLEERTDTLIGKLAAFIWGTRSERAARREAERAVKRRETNSRTRHRQPPSPSSTDRTVSRETAERLAALEEKDATNAFAVTARAVVCAPPDVEPTDTTEPPTGAADGGVTAADATARSDPRIEENATTTRTAPGETPASVASALRGAFEHASGRYYHLDGRTVNPDATWAAINTRTHADPAPESLTMKLPLTSNRSPAMITDPHTLPLFTLFSGATLPEAASDALAPTPEEQRARQPLSTEQVRQYQTEGFTLGHLLDRNDQPGDLLAIAPELQSLHTAVFGPTGAGKSTLLTRAITDNRAVTEGADIVVLPKGDGMAEALLKAHCARHGDLEDVYYFDCSETLPAMGFFDIRADLEAGIPRETAVDDRISHYVEIIKGLMGTDSYTDAKRSPDVITYLLRALFDPVNGADAFGHGTLHQAARRLRDRQAPPPVVDEELQDLLAGVVENDADTFDRIMQGVLTRIEKVPADRRLARLFGYVPGAGEATDGEPHFDLEALLDESATVIVDTSGLRDTAQRAITLVVLSQLWTALRRRAARNGDGDPPLVNLYLEEAATVADTGLLSELLSQSRSFGLAITLAMQFPGQLRDAAPRAYEEVLNEVGTILTGPVGYEPQLAERLATEDLDSRAMAARMRGLRRGQWLASLPAPFGATPPQPCLLASPSPPTGHPASEETLTAPERARYERESVNCRQRTAEEAGIQLSRTQRHTPDATPTAPESDVDDDARRPRVDTPLPYTTRFPDGLRYDAERHALVCERCGATYDPDASGMDRALACHPTDVDADDVPITELTLKLTPTERHQTGYSDAQLMFLQAVYNAQQGRYHAPEYDLVFDSMLRLAEYVGVDTDAVDALLDDGYLRHDGDHPHRLYTVTSEGRRLLNEGHRRGVAFGHGTGDLGESSQHTLGVEAGRRYLERTSRDDPDSPVVDVVPYYEPDHDAGDAGNADRLDIVGLDAEGRVRVAVEVERINNDLAEAAASDYDKMAACDPDEAIWITMTQSDGHRLLRALNDPADGDPRVTQTYAESTPLQQFRIDTPGLTAIYPVTWVRNRTHPAG